MNILITLCALAISASAQLVGPSGIVRPDGNNIQYTIEQAEKFNKDGSLPQADSLKVIIPEGSIVGASGIVSPDGTLTQFTHEQAQKFIQESSITREINNIVAPVTPTFTAPAPAPAHSERLVGPSGIVTPNGNIQFTHDQVINGNIKTTIPVSSINVPAPTQGIRFQQGDQIIILDGFTQEQVDNFEFVGPSGIVTKDGQNIQLRSRRSAEFSRLFGPSGIVDINGNTQFTIKQAEKFNKEGSLPQADDTLKINIPEGSIVGASGIITPDGTLTQFTHEQAQKFIKDGSLLQVQKFIQESSNTKEINNIVVPVTTTFTAPGPAPIPTVVRLVGPSGIVSSNGNIQFTHDQIINGNIEPKIPVSSINVPAPTQGIKFQQGDQIIILDGFTQEQVDNFEFVGPSGIVTKDGQNIQLRSRRSAEFSKLVGPSGIVDVNGNTQFTIKQAEKFNKKGSLSQADTLKVNVPEGSIVGASGIVSPDGTLTQFTHEQAQKFIKEGSLPELSIVDIEIPEDSIVGASGIVSPDGTLTQFTLEQAKFIKDRSLPELSIVNNVVPSTPTLTVPVLASIPALAPAHPERLVGPSGIVDPSGNIQFSHEQVHNKQANLNVVSPVSSIPNLLPPVLFQLAKPTIDHNQENNVIVKGSIIGFKQGDKIVILEGFTQEQADNFAYIGPSGIVTKDGNNIQLV